MDYRSAYEALSKALWQYDKTLSNAHVRLMFAVSDIEQKLNEPPKSPIPWFPNDEPDK